MTPIEFWWLYPQPEERTGARNPEWVEEMTRRYEAKQRAEAQAKAPAEKS